MPTIATKDGTQIYYKDWGKGQPIVFSHGWPLTADDWTDRCCSLAIVATESSRMTGGGTAVPARPGTAMIWTLMPTISQPSLRSLT